ncbi:hypothetical protein PN36_10475 [Candidatus Thiomargarita nelsonii]|uniref:Uncharacterized protein n=1 Tax=Candidatus Thiomargarita nelsonii TaxID=1003181 RepID=A0A4E0R4W0_9GAMM|nr:hypothetical protein PN36_10475 [Candidatus Thiomargarita nelsonii]
MWFETLTGFREESPEQVRESVNGKIGQSFNNQIDCLSDIGTVLGNKASVGCVPRTVLKPKN